MSHTKRQCQDPVLRFVDLEAQVDDEDEDDDEDLFDDDFIDDRIPNPQAGRSDPPYDYISWNNYETSETGYEGVIQFWQERASGFNPYNRPAARSNSVREKELGRSPTADDYPLWRIRCHLGTEREAVFFLHQKVTLDHQLRSAFTRTPEVPGWIYVEAKLNDKLIKLLKSTPGIIHRFPDVNRNPIYFEDWTKLLKMTNNENEASVGSWVRVRNGSYKGDVGFFVSLESWGGALVLLIPRLQPPHSTDKSSGKRKRLSKRPEPALFDPDNIARIYSTCPVYRDDGCHHFLDSRFQHGLILKKYSLHSISPTSEIPLRAYQSYKVSRHPELRAYPRPSEWVFEEGEKIVILSSQKQGTVVRVEALSVEVDLQNGEGLASIPWSDLHKVFQIGDYVEIVNRSESGTKGWVTKIKGEHIGISGDSPLPQTLDQSNKSTTTQLFHVNRVRCTTVAETHPNPRGPEQMPQRDSVPWIGMPVINTQQAHPMKGRQAIIKDVLCGQKTKSGLQVSIQYTYFDPASPKSRETIDYDSIVHAKHHIKLFDVERPKGPNSQRFEPANYNSNTSIFIPLIPLIEDNPPATLTTATGTPLPSFSPAWASAWDPLSRTPLSPTEQSPLPPSALTTQQVLLNPLLIGKKMKVSVNSGPLSGKDIIVSLTKADDNSLSIRTVRYNKSEHIMPESITPKHPNATRDNGLLVVIRGEHCGKYARRIYHRYGDSAQQLIILAVVEGLESGAQVLSRELLNLKSSDLCLCDETKEQQRVGKALMAEVRKEAGKVHGM